MKNRKLQKVGSNAIDPATTHNMTWGFNPVPNKGGATTNFAIPEWMFDAELKLMYENGGVAVA